MCAIAAMRSFSSSGQSRPSTSGGIASSASPTVAPPSSAADRRSRAHLLEEDLPRERVAVRVQARRCEPDADLSGPHAAPVEELLARDRADDEAREVEIAGA
jgi:hypothetical protein